MQRETTLWEVKEGIGWLTINRPEKLNILGRKVLQEIGETAELVEKDKEVKVLVITGAGEKAFVAGADVGEMWNFSAVEAYDFTRYGQETFLRIEQLTKPTIAAINGYALGGGLELALACHIRLASENARLGLPEINLGILPGWGGVQRLIRLLPKNIALELLLTGEHISAQDAHRLGLVNHVYPAAEFKEKVQEFAKKLASQPPVSVRLILDGVNQGTIGGIKEGLDLDAALISITFATEDKKEGFSAFREKRKPVWKGI
ncbi:MAG: enoyl-CoA hydratase/isomerase family protein [bacterium JZ-2024 1]